MRENNQPTVNTSITDDEYVETKTGIRYYPKARLWVIRGRVVMFDNEVAAAYEKEIEDLKQIIDQDAKQPPCVFDETLCFQLTSQEYRGIRGDRYFTGVLRKRRTIRDLPFVFTEMGAMRIGFSFRTEKAIEQSKNIVTQFVAIRQLVRTNPNALVAVVRNTEEKQLTEVITNSLASPMPVPAFHVPPLPNLQSGSTHQSIVLSNIVNHGTISVAMHHEASHSRRLEQSIIPDGGLDAEEAVVADPRPSETTKAELKVAIQDVMKEHDCGRVLGKSDFLGEPRIPGSCWVKSSINKGKIDLETFGSSDLSHDQKAASLKTYHSSNGDLPRCPSSIQTWSITCPFRQSRNSGRKPEKSSPRQGAHST